MIVSNNHSPELTTIYSNVSATHQDTVLAVLPFFHIYAATVIMFHKMSLGLKLVTLSKLQPDHYFETLEKYKTNILFVAPPLGKALYSARFATLFSQARLPRTLVWLQRETCANF